MPSMQLSHRHTPSARLSPCVMSPEDDASAAPQATGSLVFVLAQLAIVFEPTLEIFELLLESRLIRSLYNATCQG